MKKTIYALLFMLLSSAFIAPSAKAQNFDEVYNRYKRQEGIMRVKVPKMGIALAGLFVDADEKEAKMFLRHTTAVRVIINENSYRQDLADNTRKWQAHHKLEELVTLSDEGDEVEIYVLEKNNIIRQMLIMVSSSEDEQVVVHVKGNYPLEMIKKMISDGDMVGIAKNVR